MTEYTTITQIGQGQGTGQEEEVLAREEIERILDKLYPEDAIIYAYRAMIPGYAPGYCAIDLEDGEIISFSLPTNSRFQACDANHIIVMEIGQHYYQLPQVLSVVLCFIIYFLFL